MSRAVPVKLAYNYIEPEGCIADKAPVIFLHGVTVSKEIWFDIPDIVARETKRKVYNVDARNHGDSEWSDIFDFSIVVDDFLHFLDIMDIHKAIVVGLSMGGLTAMVAACREPERFEKIVIEDIGVRSAPPEIFDFIPFCLNLGLKALEYIPESDDEISGRKFVGEFVYESLPALAQADTSPSRLENAFHLKRGPDGRLTFKNNVKVIANTMRLQKEKKVEPRAGKYAGPAYFIYGKISPFKVGEQEEDIRLNFPHAEFIGIDGARHGVHLDRRAEFEQALLQCLEEK